MLVKELLKQLNLGKSVAEYEDSLSEYFLKTDIFNSLVNDEIDIISGDKGTGKTAIYTYINHNYRNIPELNNIEVIPAINPTGSPIFEMVTQEDNIDENRFINLWKWYIFSLIGNWILNVYKEDTRNKEMKTLENILIRFELRTTSYTPKTVFEKVLDVSRSFMPKEIKFPITLQDGTTISTDITFDEVMLENKKGSFSADDALHFLNRIISNAKFNAWVIMDRIDEISPRLPFTGYIAVRSLFRTYLDFTAFRNIKIKIFIRNDLFQEMTGGIFVNLTHINPRKDTIYWSDDDLFKMIINRIRLSNEFIKQLNLEYKTDKNLFDAIFPSKINKDVNSKTWKWILQHIRDGKNIKSPRNIIDIVNFSIKSQNKRGNLTPREYTTDISLIESESIQEGYIELSKQRVRDTLIGESDDLGKLIIKGFINGKSEHNLISITNIINKITNDATPEAFIEFLINTGLLELTGSTYRIPFLYRPGLNVKQGKAF